MPSAKQKLKTSPKAVATDRQFVMHFVVHCRQSALLTFQKTPVEKQNLNVAYLPDSSHLLLGRKKLEGTPNEVYQQRQPRAAAPVTRTGSCWRRN